LIDLHIHTTASDGSATPAAVIQEAKSIGLEAISITDHDTFDAYEEAVPAAREAGLQLIWGIEISTKLVQPGKPFGKTVHLLGYFPKSPTPEFLEWIKEQQQARHERNIQLSERLRELNIDVTIDEVKALGRNMAGRPHFARLMVRKGYVQTIQEAFDKYLDERGQAFVEKHDPALAEGIRHIRDAGGVSSLAHPVRLNKLGTQEEDLIRQMAKMGMHAIEAYHCDHTERHLERYQLMARRYDLTVTGGSDYHGDLKPDVKLGTGRNNNIVVPNKVLDRLRALTR